MSASTTIEIDGGPFGFIMADPAWRFATYSAKGKEQKSAEVHYETMSLTDIKALDVAGIAAKDCLLWLWATRPMLLEALEVVTSWGFVYSTIGAWGKLTKHGKRAFGTGYMLREAHELFIIAKRGKPKVYSRSVRSLIDGKLREHSRKPEEAYAAAELLAGPVPKADLFSREQRPGWSNWGREKDKFTVSEVMDGLMGFGG